MREPSRTAAYDTYLVDPGELLELLGIPAGELVSCCPESHAGEMTHIQITVRRPVVDELAAPGGRI